jgi:hypothetical protein
LLLSVPVASHGMNTHNSTPTLLWLTLARKIMWTNS